MALLSLKKLTGIDKFIFCFIVYTDPDCRNNPSYNVVPESVHLRNTPAEIVTYETLDTYDDTVAVQGTVIIMIVISYIKFNIMILALMA